MTALIRLSKFVSLVLRHQPAVAGLTLDPQGWVSVADLLSGSLKAGVPLTQDLLDQVVNENNKKRFEYNGDKSQIRARQGHSAPVDLGYTPSPPPEFLYHGTTTRFVDAIKATGLQKMKRHAVHLSQDALTAIDVGQRHGRPAVLTIKAQELAATGALFYKTDNNVWLTDSVPVEFIQFP